MSGFHTLQFTFGPVQGFVSQARRTRDLWAGSYLLSYLAGKAMLAVEAKGGSIKFPDVANNLLMKALRGEALVSSKRDPAARIGSLPNRFSAQVPEGVDGGVCERAVRSSWEKTAEEVWGRLEQDTKGQNILTRETEKIWKGQIESCWECSWVLGDEATLLDQRKNLRHHCPPPELGFKCTQCGEREALRGSSKDHAELTKWWRELAHRYRKYNIKQGGGERLCGVCTTKRLFPLVAPAAIGWPVETNYPSTAHLSSIDWICKVLEGAKGDLKVASALEQFLRVAREAEVEQGERATRIKSISEHLQAHTAWILLADLDGDAFFEDSIRNEKEFVLPDESKRPDLISGLRKLTAVVGAKPTPFYALLLMDGDSMGRLLSANPHQQDKISGALAEFTLQVSAIVEAQDGVLVYAGGDDVFALMPLNTALACARALKEAYVQAFLRKAPGIVGTISAAVVYAHMNTPLRTVVRDGHRLLDEIAKDEVGRNAFAVRVWKRGGAILTVAKPWCGNGTDWQSEIEALKGSFSAGEYASGFFHRLRDLFELLDPPDGASVLLDSQQVDLLAAEFMKSREREVDPQTARERVRRLRDLCREEWRQDDGIRQGRIRADGGLLLRFLVQKEV